MRRAFEKYEGLGNDFVLVDARAWPLSSLGPERVRALCDRRTGIGADGVLWIEQSPKPAMIVFNADGTRPEMCGNGARCVAAWLAAHASVASDVWSPLHTDAGDRPVRVLEQDGASMLVSVAMGIARVGTASPVSVTSSEEVYACWPVDVGNPHAVLFLSSHLSREESEKVAAKVRERRDIWPSGANVEFVVARDNRLITQVHERGVGWTQACGTGACAVVAAAIASGRAKTEQAVRVQLDGGLLEIRCEAETEQAYRVTMTGPARRVFVGEVDVDTIAPHATMESSEACL